MLAALLEHPLLEVNASQADRKRRSWGKEPLEVFSGLSSLWEM